MKKRSFQILVLLFVLVLLSNSLPVNAQQISVELDGKELKFDVPPQMIDGRIMVPLRGIFEALGAFVKFESSTQTIYASKGTTTVELTLGSTRAVVNGEVTRLEVPAQTLRGRTMVPLRFVSEALGADVKWSGSTKTVLIKSTGGDSGYTGDSRIREISVYPGGIVQPGDTIQIKVSAEPNASLSLEIEDVVNNLGLRETDDGQYETKFQVPKNTKVYGKKIIIFISKNGKEGKKIAEETFSTTIGGSTYVKSYSPKSQETVEDLRPQIVINLGHDTDAMIHRNKITLKVNDQNVISSADLDNSKITYTPSSDLPEGKITVNLKGTDSEGTEFSKKWSFTVKAKNPISSVGSNVKNDTITVGETLQVHANAEKNLTLTFDIGDLKKGIKMSETTSGKYIGKYVITQNEVGKKIYITVRTKKGGKSYSKKISDPINIVSKSKQNTMGVTGVSPGEDDEVTSPRPRIRINIHNPESLTLSKNNLSLKINGNEVKDNTDVSNTRIDFVPFFDLPEGKNTVIVQATDSQGGTLYKKWTFYVKSESSSQDMALRNVSFNDTEEFTPDKVLTVTAQGPQGMDASFDVGSLKTGVPMKETKPGYYVGKYRIQEGDQGDNLNITVNMSKDGKTYRKASSKTLKIKPQSAKDETEEKDISDSGDLKLSVTNPVNNSTVSSLKITGTATPGSTVRIKVIPNYKSSNELVFTQKVGSEGTFEQEVSFPPIIKDMTVNLHITAIKGDKKSKSVKLLVNYKK